MLLGKNTELPERSGILRLEYIPGIPLASKMNILRLHSVAQGVIASLEERDRIIRSSGGVSIPYYYNQSYLRPATSLTGTQA